MSIRTLEREILQEAREVLKNPKLKMKDILEWRAGNAQARPGEIVFRLPDIGGSVVVAETMDKREGKRKP